MGALGQASSIEPRRKRSKRGSSEKRYATRMLGRLVVISGPDSGTEFELSVSGDEVGRSSEASFRLSDPTVSRHHCRVRVVGDELEVEPLSAGEILVNDKPIRGSRRLLQGEELQLGSTRLVYVASATGPAEGIGATSITTRLGAAEVLSRERAGSGEPARLRSYLGRVVALDSATRGAKGGREAAEKGSELMLAAVDADRAGCFIPDAVGRMRALGVSALDRRRRNTNLAASQEVIDAVLGGSGVITQDPGGASTETIAVPISTADGRRGILVLDRLEGGREPWGEDDLRFCLCAALALGAALDWHTERSRLLFERQALVARSDANQDFVGSSRAATAVKTFIAKAAPTDATVLLIGESGVGKEVIAHSIHDFSMRKEGPFVAVNCAALRETLVESELFGHERGAFTGATEQSIGRFERADGGTLFLDEIGELDERCQTKLLRVLEERCFERVGGSEIIAVDTRVVAATNRNLEDEVRRGAFREDLYYRLSVVRMTVPPLRERRDDIPELSSHLLERLGPRLGRRVSGFTEEAIAAIIAYDWPGNVRELRNAIERAGVMGEGLLIGLEDLPSAVVAASGRHPISGQPIAPRTLREAECNAILHALRASKGNKSEAARILGIDRSTLYKKLGQHGIDDA